MAIEEVDENKMQMLCGSCSLFLNEFVTKKLK